MTDAELRKYRVEGGLLSSIFEFIARDDYGVYSTGEFKYHGCDILITIDAGRWHLSISTNHPLGYYELKSIRYKFLPDGMEIAQIFPPRQEFVNIDENCYHLWQIKDNMEQTYNHQNEKETK